MELRNVLQINDFKLFDFNYPIADLTWKEEFEKLFIDYFYFYEIGQETIDRFKHTLKVRLNLIMPYYNELFKTTLMEIDPLTTTRLSEVIVENHKTSGEQQVEGKTNINSNTTTTEYPQHEDISNDIPSRREGDVGKTDNTSKNSFSDNSLKDYRKIIEGFQGDQSSLLKSYRDNIVNINSLIIAELKELFILVY